jgi:hypothetical protein
MIDAHVHLGWYSRKKTGLHYYSPRRILGVLDRCGVESFIVSSTTAQAIGATIDGVVSEAREMRRLAGARAKIFYWLSGAFYEKDPDLTALETGLFDGIKLHELEGRWVEKHPEALRRVLRIAQERGLPVQFHSGPDEFCSPRVLAKFALEFPSVRFDFAHCRPMGEMSEVVAACPNVWTDMAFMGAEGMRELSRYDWHGRLMFGSDVPTWQSRGEVPLTRRLRERLDDFERTGLDEESDRAFAMFMGTNERKDTLARETCQGKRRNER